MSKENRILFVEGIDDQHTIFALCEHFKVEETFIVEIPDGKGKINKHAKPHEKGGIENVLKAMQGFLATQNIERLGIVIDADENLLSQWQRVKSVLEKTGYLNIPAEPNPNGTIIEQENMIKFGVWIMPDNQIYGMLEDFLSLLIPDKDTNQVWAKAVKCSQEVLDEVAAGNRFGEIHLSKAQIHAYLAWQKECGKPFGFSITAKYLQADNPNCENFVNWLKRLFVE